MSYPGRIRIAGPEEEDAIMVLCRELHGENGVFPLDETKVREMLQRAFKREGGVLGVVGDVGALEGVIYMLVSTYWYSTCPHLEELFLYVKPEHRRSQNAIELMRFAKWCSVQTGFPLIIGVFSNERTEGKIRLYQRQFSKSAGNFFFFQPDAKDAPVPRSH